MGQEKEAQIEREEAQYAAAERDGRRCQAHNYAVRKIIQKMENSRRR